MAQEQEQEIKMEIEQLELQVSELKVDVRNVKTEVQNGGKKLDSLLYLLGGSEFDKGGGLVQKVETMEKRLTKIENLVNKAIWIGIGISIPASVGIVQILGKIISALFIKQ